MCLLHPEPPPKALPKIYSFLLRGDLIHSFLFSLFSHANAHSCLIGYVVTIPKEITIP